MRRNDFKRHQQLMREHRIRFAIWQYKLQEEFREMDLKHKKLDDLLSDLIKCFPWLGNQG